MNCEIEKEEFLLILEWFRSIDCISSHTPNNGSRILKLQ